MAESLVCAYDTNRIGHRQGGGKLILLGVGDYLTIPFQEGKLIESPLEGDNLLSVLPVTLEAWSIDLKKL